MNSFISDFLSYFFPTSSLPDWMQVFVGLMLLCMILKVIMFVLDRR